MLEKFPSYSTLWCNDIAKQCVSLLLNWVGWREKDANLPVLEQRSQTVGRIKRAEERSEPMSAGPRGSSSGGQLGVGAICLPAVQPLSLV